MNEEEEELLLEGHMMALDALSTTHTIIQSAYGELGGVHGQEAVDAALQVVDSLGRALMMSLAQQDPEVMRVIANNHPRIADRIAKMFAEMGIELP